jgi:hypothetical protein
LKTRLPWWTSLLTPACSRRPAGLNYSIPEAVGEQIDNEVDARRAGELLSVEVYIGTKAGRANPGQR